MMSFYHNVIALLHFLLEDHQLIDKFQNGNKILIFLKAVNIIKMNDTC